MGAIAKKMLLWFSPLLIFSLLAIACGELTGNPSADNSPVIGRAGNAEISWQYLQRSFNLDPQWGRGLTNREAYLNQAEFLLNRKLFALRAVQTGLDQDSATAGYLRFIEQKEVIKELYREDIASKINISEEACQQAYRMIKRKVKYRYVFTPDSLRALEWARTLSGISPGQLQPSASESSGSSDWLTFGEMEPALEAIVFDMKPQEVSSPIRLKEGFLIVQLLDGQIDKFMSAMDFAEKKSKLQKVLFDRRAAEVSNRYIKTLMLDKQLQLNPHIFHALAAAFAREVAPKSSSTPFPLHLSREEISHIRNSLPDIAAETLITHRNGRMTVAEFLTCLANMPSGLRPKVAMEQDLKDAVGVAVRNQYLYRQGQARGLHLRDEVRQEVAIQRDEVLARRYLEQLQNGIRVSAPEVQEFREKPGFSVVQTQLGNRLDEEAIADILHDRKLAELKLQELLRLREAVVVTLDTTSLLKLIPKPDEVISDDPIRFAYRELFN